MQEQDWQPSRVVHCPNCGAPNPAQTVFCSTCGMRFPESAADEEVVIDVSTGQPQVLRDDTATGHAGQGPFGGFTTVTVNRGRVFVSQGSGRGCMLAAIIVTLVFCCLCYFLWSVPAQLF